MSTMADYLIDDMLLAPMMPHDIGTSRDELTPCPFCGRIPTLSKFKHGYTIDHVCTFIDPTWFPTKEQAVSAWNTRW